MDGHPRQNPAYRPATENPRKRGGFLYDLSLRNRHGTGQAALGGFTGTARGGHPAVASRLCRQHSTCALAISNLGTITTRAWKWVGAKRPPSASVLRAIAEILVPASRKSSARDSGRSDPKAANSRM